jgi:malate dehydrogenase (oxaloacetate-decarboxylating)
MNALKVVGKAVDEVRCVINGAGSAGIAIARHLQRMGVKHLTLCDRAGILCRNEQYDNPAHNEMAACTNEACLTGSLADAMAGADVFIGVSAPGVVTPAMVASMADKPIVFPMANPVPEIDPAAAKAAGAYVVGTGRSDYPNQINNVLAFPGIFRGALDVRARDINDEMKLAASKAIAGLVSDEDLTPEYILPKAFDPRVGSTVAAAVADAAKDSGVARA